MGTSCCTSKESYLKIYDSKNTIEAEKYLCMPYKGIIDHKSKYLSQLLEPKNADSLPLPKKYNENKSYYTKIKEFQDDIIKNSFEEIRNIKIGLKKYLDLIRKTRNMKNLLISEKFPKFNDKAKEKIEIFFEKSRNLISNGNFTLLLSYISDKNIEEIEDIISIEENKNNALLNSFNEKFSKEYLCEMEALKIDLKYFFEKNLSLEGEIVAKGNKITDLTRSLNKKTSEISDLIGKQNDANESLNESKSKLSDLNNKFNESMLKIKAIENENEKQKDFNNNLKVENSNCISSMQKLTSENKQLTSENKKIKQDVISINNELSEFKKNYENQKAENKKLISSINSLNSQIESQTFQLDALKSNLKIIESQNRTIEESKSSRNNESKFSAKIELLSHLLFQIINNESISTQDSYKILKKVGFKHIEGKNIEYLRFTNDYSYIFICNNKIDRD